MTGRILNGTYRLLERIGAGGMAEVYKAEQLTPPKRIVAVKVLKGEYESDVAFVRRFAQEAEAVLVLSHDHIVRSYDVGMDECMHYIVLEYVEGDTLKGRIRESGSLPLKTLVDIGGQVLDALSHAHEKGIIHRDVKPQNIIVTPKGKAKLADFGIARQTASENTQTYMGGNVLGSVHYLSPEQAKGEPVTVESDIYAMGVTLYEMATGVLPFEGESSVAVAVKHISEQPVPPIEINPGLPPALNDIILKALDKDPAQRYHSAKQMRQDLFRVLRDPNGKFARQAVPRQKPTGRRRGGRGVVRIMLAAFVLIGLFVVLLLTGQNRTNPGGANSAAEVVPTLVGKSLEEARDIAKKRGYNTEIVETVVSDQYESGQVVNQYPLAGTSLKSGSTIQITISGGVVEISVPDVVTMSLAEAEAALTEAGLQPGNIEYQVDTAPVGTVIRQDPAADAALLPEDEVDLVVSGQPARSIEAPEVLRMPLAEALAVLQERGFASFRVYLATPDENAAASEPGVVVRQSPAPGEQFLSSGKFALTISGTALYAAEQVIKGLDVPERDSSLRVVLAREAGGIPYEYVVFETTLREGDQDISFTAAASEGGEHRMLVYLNGTQVRELSAIFTYRG